MTAKELTERFGMSAHPENGAFIERHYAHEGSGRAESGSIYYYVGPEELTAFHVIDCDEYWCYAEGSALEIWIVDPADGRVEVKCLGVDGGCEPFVYIRRGLIFASRHRDKSADGTFITCITVPRFDYEGFTMIPDSEVREKYPLTEKFFEK